MLRHVTTTSATIWVETDARCTVEILGHRTPTFCVGGHHFGLVMIEGLQPATSIPYDVRLDGELRWPLPESTYPASRIRTMHEATAPRIMFGSCRTAAPHEAPWSLELALDTKGRGVDALYAYALRMRTLDPSEWPDLAVFLGDQVYADDSSPKVRARVEEKRKHEPETTLPPELVRDFEEFCWLYEESWSAEDERWFFSVVPTVMIFDDHDMIDDWNISASWVRDIRREDWWDDHVLGGLMTYWLYQHLGNLSPEDVRADGMLKELTAVPDGQEILRQWAMTTEEITPGRDRYRFGFARDLGRVRLVMLDARNGRVLTPGQRRLVDEAEWRWLVEACRADVDHLLIGSSLPVFVPGGLHDLQVWNAAVCDGAWGRLAVRRAEKLRRRIDLEDWPAFIRSFDDLVGLLAELGKGERGPAPATISLLSGDIHFSYVSEIAFPHVSGMQSRVYQLVNSPIRNALRPHERSVMRFAASRVGQVVARLLRRSVRARHPTVKWKLDRGPVFANCIGMLDFDGRAASLLVEQARPYDKKGAPSIHPAFRVDLDAGADVGVTATS